MNILFCVCGGESQTDALVGTSAELQRLTAGTGLHGYSYTIQVPHHLAISISTIFSTTAGRTLVGPLLSTLRLQTTDNWQ